MSESEESNPKKTKSKPVVDETWDDVELPEEYWDDEFEEDEFEAW
ncbi:MAG: hypothetical protein R6V83_03980 [Candidatus Thorarchaeota archaeon]